MVALATAVALLVVGGVVLAGARASGAGPLTADGPPDATPGMLLGVEPYSRGIPSGARAWRMLYTSTDPADDAPIRVSAVVVVPDRPAGGPRPVIAWAHGTTGVADECAPSTAGQPLFGVPALETVVDEGWAIVATDYPGLGTPGQHPYLVGESAGRSVLDAVRAARDPRVPADLADEVVVWGHSQGGQAALFAGQIAPAYAPDVSLSGVAALAPPTDLPALVREVESSPTGRLYLAEAVVAWSRYYPDLDLTDALLPGRVAAVTRIADRCLTGPAALLTLAEASLLPDRILRPGLWDRPAWRRALEANVPDDPIDVPLLIAQGGADIVVPAAQTRANVDARCARGERVRLRVDAEADHLSVLMSAADELTAWTRARIAGSRGGAGCP